MADEISQAAEALASQGQERQGSALRTISMAVMVTGLVIGVATPGVSTATVRKSAY